MADSKVKVEYTSVPFEDPEKSSGSKKMEGKMLTNNDKLPTYFVNNATHDCYFRRYYEKRKAWNRALILILLVFLSSKILFGWFSFCAIDNNESNDEDQYLWIETSSNDNLEASPFYLPGFPISPKCEPTIKWDGPSEIILDQKKTSGLIFKIKGSLPRGSVTIRQDPEAKDYINITNHIYIGNESLQEKVHVKISYFDEDYIVTVETPSFNFPPNKKNCILVDTIITIPHTVKIFKSLSIDIPNGLITTDSSDIIDFAYVNLKATNGHIRVDNLTVANADVSTVNGRVSGTFIVGESLEVRTINGRIDVKVVPNPRSDNVFVGVSSFSGSSDIEVNELKEHHKFNLKGHIVNGRISATMPETYEGDFLVSSVTSYAYVEGEGITFRKNTHNHKEGYKSYNNKSTSVKRRNCKHEFNSNLNLTSVTGASELYFV